ncbi:hypothetical protein [Microbacterium sp. NPDC058345]|uniref:hypothetical protein n=1 Tax=Microbacterium sp. NPDC058345 TaxID=3346455 RepID=UPI00366094F5
MEPVAYNEAGVMFVSATENIDETPSGMLLCDTLPYPSLHAAALAYEASCVPGRTSIR